MSRYAEIADDLARMIRDGALGPGDELPALRDSAQRYTTTASTVTRSYRRLADAGVIVLGDRRRANVAAEGTIAAARLLDGDRVFRLAGSDDPALLLALEHVGPDVVVTAGVPGSFQGLRALVRGDADGAAIHLRHRNGTYNAPFAAALLRGRDPHVLHLWRREQGLILPPGNPAHLTAARDLARVRLARREVGAGTRVLLDQLLIDDGIDPDQVAGPEFPTHLEVGLAVASGIADAGFGLRALARDLDLDFVPIVWESYEIVLPAHALGGISALRTALRDAELREAVVALGGYDPGLAGELRSAIDTTAHGALRHPASPDQVAVFAAVVPEQQEAPLSAPPPESPDWARTPSEP